MFPSSPPPPSISLPLSLPPSCSSPPNSPLLQPPPPTLAHFPVQLKDMQGHLYTARNVKVRFSEPNTDPIPDSKQRMLLSNAVQSTVTGRDGKPEPTVKIGEVVTLGEALWLSYNPLPLMDVKG